jgi:hypothetical protein
MFSLATLPFFLVDLPVEQAEVFLGVFIWLIILVVGIVVRVLILVWVYRDAQSRGKDATLWLLIVLFAGLIGLIIYLVVRDDRPRYQYPAYYPPPPQPPYPPGHAPGPYQPPVQQQGYQGPYERTYYDEVQYEDYYTYENK